MLQNFTLGTRHLVYYTGKEWKLVWKLTGMEFHVLLDLQIFFFISE
jgi:hypothetical protein